jgi:hypothetical protein
VYFLSENFRVLGKVSEAKTTLAWGIASVILLVGVAAVSTNSPSELRNPSRLLNRSWFIAEKWQLQKQVIVDSGRYQFQSSWRVFGLALLFLFAFLIVGVVEYFCLVALGLENWTK